MIQILTSLGLKNLLQINKEKKNKQPSLKKIGLGNGHVVYTRSIYGH